MVQAIPPRSAPSRATPSAPARASGPVNDTLRELERMDPDELDQLLGLKPRYDIPPTAKRSLSEIGVLAAGEGGFDGEFVSRQPAALVRAALAGTKGPLVSRWGHILARRALASRLDAPEGMEPVEFASLRLGVLNRIGEYSVARALAQDVDTDNWNDSLTDAAIDAYLGTGDIVGMCPAVQLQGSSREDDIWRMLQGICYGYAGQASRSNANLRQIARGDGVAAIDILLAQRFAGAAGSARRAINIEWDDVETLTPWRYALAIAVGEEVPDRLLADAPAQYRRMAATAPMLGLTQRTRGADLAAREGILSSQAMVDLFSQIHLTRGPDAPARGAAAQLRRAYVGNTTDVRMAALRELWSVGWGASQDDGYARYVLTAYASARIAPEGALADDAAALVTAMLSAGFDRNALRWAPVVPQGSLAWGQLVMAQQDRSNPVTEGLIRAFEENDDSTGKRKTQFLVAGLAGLDRIDADLRTELASDMRMTLTAKSRWAELIDAAADTNSAVLVSYLAAVGMQGNDWSDMTPRHLYHIVNALNRVGLSAEARMIAAEAIARG